MPNLKQENNATKARHIGHLEDDFLATQYGLKRIYKELGEIIKLNEVIIKKHIYEESCKGEDTIK